MQVRLFLLACIMLVAVLFIPSQVFAGSGLLNVVGDVQDDVSQVTESLDGKDSSKEKYSKEHKGNKQQQKVEKSNLSLSGVVSDSVDTVSQTVNGVTKEVTDVTEEVGDVTKEVTNEVTEVTKSVENVTNGATSGVTEVTEEIGDVTENVTDEVTEVTKEVSNVTEEVTKEVTQTTEEVTNTKDEVEIDVDANIETSVQDTEPTIQVNMDEEVSVEEKDESISENDKTKPNFTTTSTSDAKKENLAELFREDSSSSVDIKTDNKANLENTSKDQGKQELYNQFKQPKQDSNKDEQNKSPDSIAIIPPSTQTIGSSNSSQSGSSQSGNTFNSIYALTAVDQEMNKLLESPTVSFAKFIGSQWDNAPPSPPPKKASSFSNQQLII